MELRQDFTLDRRGGFGKYGSMGDRSWFGTVIEGVESGVCITDGRTMTYRVYGATSDAPEELELYLDFAFEEEIDLPEPLFVHRDGVYARVKGDGGRLRAPLIAGEFRHFFDDVKNYSYLPEEDMAIHNSVAQYVDRAHRKRATKETCYVRREGLFVPVPKRKRRRAGETADTPSYDALAEREPLFQEDFRDRRRYVEYTKEKDMHDYLVHVLHVLLY